MASPVTARGRRYPSDTTRAEWRLLQPLLPTPAAQTSRGGRPEVHDRRAIVDALRYVVDNGAKWRALPADFPPWRTVYGFFERWTRAGIIGRILDQLRQRIRTRRGYSPQAVAVIVDSQSVKASETVGRHSRGFDAGKRINGRKRALAVDLGGLPLLILVTSADRQDRDLARDLLWRLRITFPAVSIVWADSAFGGGLVEWAKRFLNLTIKVVPRPKESGFVVLPRRWVVERTISWLLRARRNIRDHERLPQNSESVLNIAAITLMTRRLTRRRGVPRPTAA